MIKKKRKKSTLKKVLATTGAVVGVGAIALTGAVGVNEIKNKDASIAELKTEATQQEQLLTQVNTKLDATEVLLDSTLEQLQLKQAELNASNANNVELQASLTQAQALVEDYKEDIEKLRAMVEDTSAQAPTLTNSEAIELQNTLIEFVSVVNADIAELNATIANKDATIAELNNQLEQLNASIADKDATIEELEAQIRELKVEGYRLLGVGTYDLFTISDGVGNSCDVRETHSLKGSVLKQHTQLLMYRVVDEYCIERTDISYICYISDTTKQLRFDAEHEYILSVKYIDSTTQEEIMLNSLIDDADYEVNFDVLNYEQYDSGDYIKSMELNIVLKAL